MEELLLGILAVFGSTAAWKYWENRAKEKRENDDFIKKDCRERITKLETLLKEASEEKDELRKQVLELSKMVAELTTKVEFLEKEKKIRKKGRTNEE